MKLVNSQQMYALEKQAEDMGISTLVLMENAGVKMAEYILNNTDFTHIVVVCGGGNNGGDGFVVARQLFLAGKNVSIFKAFKEEKLTENALINYNIVKNLNIKFVKEKDLYTCDLIVDCLLGIGVKGSVRDDIADIIDSINDSKAYVISADMPSGICADTGKICKNAVKADETIIMGYGKTGLFTGAGYAYSGKKTVISISIPKAQDTGYYLTDEKCLEKWQVKSTPLDNKGTNGTVGIVAGGKGMTGAAALSALGALRSGAGIVKVLVPENLCDILETKVTESITVPLDCQDFLDEKGALQVIEYAKNLSVLAIGPGLGRSDKTIAAVNKILKNVNIPVIIDADGIYGVSRNINILKETESSVILTPHPGEFSFLTGLTVEEIEADRINLAKKFASDYNVTLLLKGAGSVIATPDGEVYINPTGNEGMAKGGSGDVLTGIISAVMAKGCENPAAFGAYLHGRAGDKAEKALGKTAMLPSDILKFL